MARYITLLALGSALVFGGLPAAFAQDVPGHPHVNEVDQRLINQQRRIDGGVNAGQIGARAEARDAGVDNRVARQLSRDEARHNGHITGVEYRQLNRELNGNSARIYAQRHR